MSQDPDSDLVPIILELIFLMAFTAKQKLIIEITSSTLSVTKVVYECMLRMKLAVVIFGII
jgi:hypothetical protein